MEISPPKESYIFHYSWFEYYLGGKYKAYDRGFAFCKIKLVSYRLFFLKFNKLKCTKVKLDLRESSLTFVPNGVLFISFMLFEIYATSFAITILISPCALL